MTQIQRFVIHEYSQLIKKLILIFLCILTSKKKCFFLNEKLSF